MKKIYWVKTLRKSLALFLASLIALGALSACGGSGGGGGGTTAAAETTAATTAAAAETTAAAAETTAAATEAATTTAKATEAAKTTAAAAATTTAATTTEAAKIDEVVTLTFLLSYITGQNVWNTTHDGAVQQKIKDELGVVVEIMTQDQEKYNVILASGDLPDIIMVNADKDDLVRAGTVIPMDGMLEEHGQDILKNIPEFIEYTREFVSGGTGGLYFLNPQIGPGRVGQEWNLNSIHLRWDLYKKLGCPPIDSMDGLLDIIEQIRDLEPVNEDGQTVYGLSFFTNWGPRWIASWIGEFFGKATCSNFHAIDTATNDAIDVFLDTANSPYWLAAEFLNKAWRRGLVNPDSPTMNFEELSALTSDGRNVISYAFWWGVSGFNGEHEKDAVGYMSIPTPLTPYAFGGDNLFGWSDKAMAISNNCKHPEKAMDFLNYLYSQDGARTLYSGVEGVHWDMVGGKPRLRDEVLRYSLDGGEEWSSLGIEGDVNRIGLTPFFINKKDGEPINLFYTDEVLGMNLTPLQKDFSDYYGADYPWDAFIKLLDKGAVRESQKDEMAIFSMLDAPEDVSRLEVKISDILAKQLIKCIIAETNEEFLAIREETLGQLKDAGCEEVTKYYHGEWARTRALSAKYQ